MSEARAKAREYLDLHGDYVAAMRALLADLDEAYRAGRVREEELLCEASGALRAICEGDGASGAGTPRAG